MVQEQSVVVSKLRKLSPKVLVPPKDVLDKIKQKKNEALSKIPIVKFFQTFFGEGF